MSLNKMLDAYEKKFPGVNRYVPIKDLLYYDDMKRNQPLILTSGVYKWNLIEKRLSEMVDNPDKLFDTFPLKRSAKVDALEKETVTNAISFVKGYKKLPWLEDSFNSLCDEVLKDNDVNSSFYKKHKEYLVRKIVSMCSTKLEQDKRI